MVIELSKTFQITDKVKTNRRKKVEKGNCWEVIVALNLTKMTQIQEANSTAFNLKFPATAQRVI